MSWKLTVQGRYLKRDGQPFFYLGDTAWLLFHALTDEQAYVYLKNRAVRGFTVIQAVAVMQQFGLDKDKNHPYQNDDPRVVDEQSPYWDRVDRYITMARALGLYVALLPTWGIVVRKNDLTAQDAAPYAAFMAKRFGHHENLIWVVGGDCMGSDHGDYWNAFGAALKAACPDRLITYHTFGRTLSADFFADAPWLDFDMFQSGHRDYSQVVLHAWDDVTAADYSYGEDNWRYVRRAYALTNRPVLDGEPSYENIPHGLHDPTQPRWTAHDVRRYAWWSVLEGACGFTFGHNAIMQFWPDGQDGSSYGCTDLWPDAICHEGASGVVHLKNLLEEFAWQQGEACHDRVILHDGERYSRIAAFAGQDFALFYTFLGDAITLRGGSLPFAKADVYWVSPLTGQKNYVGSANLLQNTTLTPPPGQYAHKDWALLLTKK